MTSETLQNKLDEDRLERAEHKKKERKYLIRAGVSGALLAGEVGYFFNDIFSNLAENIGKHSNIASLGNIALYSTMALEFGTFAISTLQTISQGREASALQTVIATEELHLLSPTYSQSDSPTELS